MIPLTLGQVAAITGGTLAGADPAATVTGEFVIDSRRAAPGGVFVAVAGERVDGHAFGPAAVALGAVAMLGTRAVDGVPAVVVADVPAELAALARHVLSELPGAVVAGIGQGISFSRGLAAVAEQTPPERRGEVSSTYFVVAYVAIALPVIGEGLAAEAWGLRTAGIAFASAVSVLAAMCLAAILVEEARTRR